jgi:uncharacterized protein YutE (UPF0331/DUF86 family)
LVLRIEALRERLARLEEVISRLQELTHLPRSEYLADYRHSWLAERGLELGAQAILDIGNHILAGHFGESAREYEEILRRLGQRGVLSPDLTARLEGLGGFRNVLVHGYLGIDPHKVYDALQRAPRDFTDFQLTIADWIDELERGPSPSS